MSRIGKLPITIPQGVTVTVADSLVTVVWPKWTLTQSLVAWVVVTVNESDVIVSVEHEELKAFWGLTRALINNMIIWVTEWYEKKLQVIWVWYSAKVQWKSLILNLWYSHPINHTLPDIVDGTVEKDPKWNDMIVLTSINKQQLWEQAAKIRSYRKPEPYKWKWVRYWWEQIKMKAWKTATK